MTEGEKNARILHYWSKIRQALKTSGDLVVAAEWLESAIHAEGPEVGKALRTKTSQLCRGVIDR